MVDECIRRNDEEGTILKVDDIVTLTRRMGIFQVRGKLIKLHTIDEGVSPSYDTRTNNRTILCVQLSEC